MKRIRLFVISLMAFAVLALSACSEGETAVKIDQDEEVHRFVQIKSSPDKYTEYLKDYVSRNCATVGYESMGGERLERLGNTYIKIRLVTPDGEYIGISDDELKDYVVISQSYEPNTEIKMTYKKNSEGEEYSSLIEWQNLEELVLKVRKVGGKKPSDTSHTYISLSPDKYTYYVRDYVGRNLSQCGYISLGGDFRDRYGEGTIKLNLVTNDGSYIDLKEEGIVNNYVVIGQSHAPNTEITYKFWTYSTGEESTLVDDQNIDRIDLYLKKIG